MRMLRCWIYKWLYEHKGVGLHFSVADIVSQAWDSPPIHIKLRIEIGIASFHLPRKG